jgi:NO-binding membrane sensor protein with MHYT domain
MSGTYNPWLVLLSYVVAILASFVALDLAACARHHRHEPIRRHLWLAAGAASMGSGIWSMHFIGMLAFRLPIELSYDLALTALSLLIAIVASGFALFIASGDGLGPRRLAVAGVTMGLAIISMHYIGMAAMKMDPPIRYDAAHVALSICIAVAASTIALWCAFRLRQESLASAFWQKSGSAVVMGSGIYGMHYASMVAASFAPDSVSRATGLHIEPHVLGAAIGVFILLFLFGTLLASAYDAYRAAVLQGQLNRVSQRLVQVQDEERRAIAAALHDIVGQELSALNTDLALIRQRLPPGAHELAGRLASAYDQVRDAVTAVRHLMVQLRPPGLDQLGLPAALRWHGEAFEARTGIELVLDIDEELPRPAQKVEDALLRIYMEGLQNIGKHAAAKRVEVTLTQRDGQVVLAIQDDGRGFEPTQCTGPGAKSGWGLMIMKERAAAVGAAIEVRARPGRGTRIAFLLSKEAWH